MRSRLEVAASATALIMLANSFVSSSATFASAFCPMRSKGERFAFISSNNIQNYDFSIRKSYALKDSFALNMVQEDEKNYMSPMRQRPRPKGGDTAYANENILRQLRHYNNIRKVGGRDCVQDVYAKDPNTSGNSVRYWFVGKVARCTGTVSQELAIARQFNLIEEHATRIRPIELGRSFGSLEIYVAPGDTELLCAQNDPGIRLQKVPRYVEGSENVALLEVGLNLEIVTNQGAGFCVVRTEDGVVPPDLIGK
mmetsp:Transcript_1028/g.1785  ORF Transcript_1028/g.1785 Transcript_1028/m.1785 type:complete len:254 (-) Transcript_1028:387-1148(-)|eukprot:CAMPEP_0183726014 /NCGR_PEP_ID=MMETSP0737-20130205/22124_1 /TAXON_ID=385413 /ORGANISM="Thalassiosira miniscula, Strain CCMP1093" /LENGTH=253 /DNA_ID=CAMNT_0025957211 /DNA_START=235 /DNA_END=996 /DNA_ORIENTATION=+